MSLKTLTFSLVQKHSNRKVKLLTFSLVLVHLDCHHSSSLPVLGVHVLVDVTEGSHAHAHHHLVEVSSLVDPAPVLGERVQLIIGDQIRLEILLPVSNTLRKYFIIKCLIIWLVQVCYIVSNQ